MPRYEVEVLEHVNHTVTLTADNEDTAMALAASIVEAGIREPFEFVSETVLVDAIGVVALDNEGCHHEGCETPPVAADYDWNRWCEPHLREAHPYLSDGMLAALVALGPDNIITDDDDFHICDEHCDTLDHG